MLFTIAKKKRTILVLIFTPITQRLELYFLLGISASMSCNKFVIYFWVLQADSKSEGGLSKENGKVGHDGAQDVSIIVAYYLFTLNPSVL